jgi:hypothetical protein
LHVTSPDALLGSKHVASAEQGEVGAAHSSLSGTHKPLDAWYWALHVHMLGMPSLQPFAVAFGPQALPWPTHAPAMH